MSPREKKLLIFFGAAGFIVLNFLAFAQFQAKRLEFDRSLDEARRQLDTAKMFSASRDLVNDQMDWLAAREPQPAAKQDVQTKLVQLCDTEAKNANLEIREQKTLETDTTGTHYHRVKVQFTVTGNEADLYRWFDRLNVPEQLRAATNIRLAPNAKDDTKIDCTAVVEQWFVPAPAA